MQQALLHHVMSPDAIIVARAAVPVDLASRTA